MSQVILKPQITAADELHISSNLPNAPSSFICTSNSLLRARLPPSLYQITINNTSAADAVRLDLPVGTRVQAARLKVERRQQRVLKR